MTSTRVLAPSLAAIMAIACASLAGADEWAKTLDASLDDEAYSIAPTMDGGQVLSGRTEPDQDGNADFWVVKLDSGGEIEWQRTYGGACPCEWAWSVRQTADGGYVVAGYTCSCSRSFDVWVLKLDPAGNIVWQNAYGGAEADTALVVRETLDARGQPDGYIVGGETLSFGMGDRDMLLLRLNLDGSLAWQKTYGWYGAEWLSDVEQTADGGYVVAGATLSLGEYSDAWVLKLAADGSVTWQAAYGGTGQDSASSIRETRDALGQPDGYVVAGASRSFTSGRGTDAWVLRLRLDGSVVWQKAYGGDYGDLAASIQQAFDQDDRPSGYIVTGALSAIDGGVNCNLWLLRLGVNGSVTWLSHYGGCGAVGHSAYELGRSVYQTAEGGFVTAGYVQTADWPPTSHDALIVKVAADGSLPYCGLVSSANEMIVTNTSASTVRTNLTAGDAAVTRYATEIVPRVGAGVARTTCSGRLTFEPRPEIYVVTPRPIVSAGDLLTFDASSYVHAFDGSAVARYEWDLDGDGRYDDASGSTVTHAWMAPGRYTVGLRVAVPAGKAVEASRVVAVNGVSLDVAPASCSNQLAASAQRELSVAVRGTKSFDVRAIDPSSVRLLGVPALTWSYEDVSAAPKVAGATCVEDARDGITDLSLVFDARSVWRALETLAGRSLEGGETAVLSLTASLFDGFTIQGQDTAAIILTKPAIRKLPEGQLVVK